MRSLSTAVAVFVSALAAAAPCAAADASRAAEPAAWFEAQIKKLPAGQVASLYQTSTTESEGLPPASLQGAAQLQAKATQDRLWSPERATVITTSGGTKYRWIFQNLENGLTPTSAVRIAFENPSVYKAQVVAFCEDDGTNCRSMLRLLAQVQAPDPFTPFASDSHKQWREIVARESCAPGAIDMPVPRYPSAAVRKGIGGTTQLYVLMNPCGEARGVWIAASSGNRDLDRAAVDRVRQWRMTPTAKLAALHQGGLVTVPIRFVPPSDDPPPASPTSVLPATLAP